MSRANVAFPRPRFVHLRRCRPNSVRFFVVVPSWIRFNFTVLVRVRFSLHPVWFSTDSVRNQFP
eukprot:8205906-Lingulodinium_polyedra.AAC.1